MQFLDVTQILELIVLGYIQLVSLLALALHPPPVATKRAT